MRAARRIAAVLFASVVMLLWQSPHAFAHPLGNFTINLYSGLRVVPGAVHVDYVVDMAEIPTFQEMGSIDSDGDGTASAAELDTWASSMAPRLADGVRLRIDGSDTKVEVASAGARLRPGQGGLSILRFEGTFNASVPKDGSIHYSDGNYPGRVGWREITAAGEDGEAIAGSSVPARSVSNALLSYPQDLLSSPLDVRSMSADFRPGPGGLAPQGSAPVDQTVEAAARPGVEGGPFTGLIQNSGFGLILLGIGIAIALGAWHALLPGHGKTLMAAYMVGSGARIRQAVAVGTAVAVMHTASVLALGVLVVSLQQAFRPEALYPWLGIVSGLVALGLGAHLLISRLSGWSGHRGEDRALGHSHGGHSHGSGAAPGHSHPHGHSHAHSHGHEHAKPLILETAGGGVISKRSLMALALAGGILPAPSCLIVMLASINAHRAAYGLTLVMAFSVGLATALIAIGLGALRAREAVSRRLSSSLGRLVPVMSAIAIVVVGVYLTARGFTQV